MFRTRTVLTAGLAALAVNAAPLAADSDISSSIADVSSSIADVSSASLSVSGSSVAAGTGTPSFGTSSSETSSEAISSELEAICSVDYIQSILPSNGTILGIDLLPDTVTAASVSSTYSYCNVTLEYTHTGKGDTVVLIYYFPDPSDFKNRFYLGGGGGYSLSSDASGGLEYGAVSGATDAGYDAFSYSYDEKFLYGNGSINWDSTNMFGYQALGELTVVGKSLTRGVYGLEDDSKVYTYFEGCSDGGREGMSQVQRWGEEYDGVIAGAPAFRFASQQVNHVFPAVIEQTLDYYPPTCALDKIVNLTIAACDILDGREDSVISRTDLCQLQFNLSSLVGESYYCAATSSSSLGFGFDKRAEGSQSSTTPAQNGTITEQDIAVAQQYYDGLFSSTGLRGYLSYQIGASLSDAEPTYDSETGEWGLNIPSTGGMYVAKYIELLDMDNLENLDGVTYDTLIDWIQIGYDRYLSTLQTTIPDLTPFQSNGGKLLHYHGEADSSIPAASSVHYWQSVKDIMYGNLTESEALAALDDWYQFYLVPGAGHCGSNDLQPGPYPQSNMDIIIDWVENGVKPSGLNATVSSGDYSGEEQVLCKWPLRPYWNHGNASTFDCAYDQASYESWTYTFDAFKTPIY